MNFMTFLINKHGFHEFPSFDYFPKTRTQTRIKMTVLSEHHKDTVYRQNGTRRVVMGYPWWPYRGPYTHYPGHPTHYPATHRSRTCCRSCCTAGLTGSPGSFWFQHVGHVRRSLIPVFINTRIYDKTVKYPCLIPGFETKQSKWSLKESHYSQFRQNWEIYYFFMKYRYFTTFSWNIDILLLLWPVYDPVCRNSHFPAVWPKGIKYNSRFCQKPVFTKKSGFWLNLAKIRV